MRCRVLTVLMWKHFVARKRRYIRTAVEFLAPIVLIVLLFAFRDEINPQMSSRRDGDELSEIAQTEPFSLEKVGKPPVVLYTPDTLKTQEIMKLVSEKFAKHSRRPTVFQPFYNISTIFNFTETMEYDEAIVIFQNMNGDTWPETLNYTIRMKNAFMTALHGSLNDELTPHASFGSIYEKFMALQWAIDTSYLELLTGNETQLNLKLQEFPYVRRRGSASASMVGMMMKSVCCLSLLLPFVFLATRLLEERASGIKELMKMMGVSNNLLNFAHLLNAFPPGFIFAMVTGILATVGSNPLLVKTDGFIIFIILLLYYFTIVSMAFVCSYLTKTTQYSVSLSVLVYILLWIPASRLDEATLPGAAVVLSGVLPHVPMTWLWTEVATLETIGQGVTFSTMFSSHNSQSGSVFAALLIMVWQALFFFFLAWYLSHVYPGKFGQARPWNFLCQRQYWRKNDITPDEELEELEDSVEMDKRYFEPVPPGQEVGIKILNVSKVFPKHRALNNVSLDVLKGEITVLLGHNGAGKTTLMNVITGMLTATDGKVYVNGLDVSSQRGAARQHIGLCPQHNLFFADLSVMQHVMFFHLLKGGTFAEARASSGNLLNKLGLFDKRNSMSSELSGGMKRRLQLACALAGGADVLILDEPTSGLDVETRRELWDLLLTLRGSRTVLLSTHFMEEADALGDRVAALHAGRLRCVATPLYLKKAIGTGYRLTFTTIGAPKEEAITSVVTSRVPDATVKETSINSISYNLPAASSQSFPQLFEDLENKRSELGIDSIGVGISTLEEVFLRLCSDVDTSFAKDEIDGSEVDHEPTFNRVRGLSLYLRQFKVLIIRQFYYILFKKVWFTILQVILPIVMIVLFTMTVKSDDFPFRDRSLPLTLDVYDKMADRRVLYRAPKDAGLRPLSDRYPNVLFENSSNVEEAILRSGKRDVLEYNKYLVGIELNDTDAKVLYTTTVRHAAPIGLNLLSNMMAARLLPWASGRTIITSNHPIEGAHGLRQSKIVEPKSLADAILWAVFIVFVILATNINAVSLPCKERISGARHLHIMSGAPASLHWAATLATHTALALLSLIIPACAAAALLDRTHTFTEASFVATIGVVLLLGSMAFFAVAYLVSFYVGERGASMVLVLVVVLFGIIVPALKSVKDSFKTDETKSFGDVMLLLSSYLMPPHTMTKAASQTVQAARGNAYCSLNRDKCPYFPLPDPDMIGKCCDSTGNIFCYFCFEKNAPGQMIIVLLAQIVVYMALVWLTQRGLFKWLHEQVWNSSYQPAPPQRLDEMGRAERAYVSKAIDLPTKQIPDAMLVSELHKNYRCIRKSFAAVKGISFSVKKGECFGLLGVNGAGKSTTFQLLTGERCSTRGRAFANGHHLTGYSTEYLRSLGYCPQFFGLDEFQTGARNLEMTLTLRGLNSTDVKAEAASWIEVVGLKKYANRLVSGYSGGCLRRLAAGAALASGAPVTLLDEPTAGVDVAARRRVWAALRRGLRHQRSVIITSHSMDEMEALCHRIAIMSEGELCALGSPAALRAAHAQGHAVILKVRATATPTAQGTDETDAPSTQLNKLKGTLQQKFNCTLKDEHKTMLHYHINETMPYSALFTELEALKSTFPLLEDYSVTETTLEEVFLSYAKRV